MTVDEVVRLWLTGGRDVLKALGPSGGVRNFVFDVEFPFVLNRLPLSILSSLRGLCKLAIVVKSDPIPRSNRRITIEALKSLPRSITDLTFDFNECMHDAHIPFLPPALVRLILPHNRSISAEGIEKLPRTIEVLDLSVNRHVTLSNLPPNICNITAPLIIAPGSLLPPTLTSLCVTKYGLVWDLNRESLCLPDGLMSLTLPVSAAQLLPTWELKSFDFVPTSLLELDFSTMNFTSEAIFDALPAGLKVLKLGWDLQAPPNFTDDIASKLPKLLQTLSIMPCVPITDEILDARPDFSPMTYKLLQNLPELLTLHIWILRSGPGPTEVQFKHLPFSLTDLDIRIGMRGRPTLRELPPHLTKINIRSTNSWDLPQFTSDVLPDVDRLQFCHSGSSDFGWTLVIAGRRGPTWWKNLVWPSRLVALRANLPAKTVQSLPKTLTHLELHGTTNDETIAAVPDGVKILIVQNSCDLTDDCIAALPHELEELSFLDNSRIACQDWHLPSSLRKLRITGSKNFRFDNLPSHLTYFQCPNPNISNFTISVLPKTITDLRLSRTHLVTGTCLQYLNPNMVHLGIPHADFSDGDIKNLPRFLQTLIVDRGCPDLTSSCCKDFPPLLRSLRIPGHFFTDGGIADLPRTLKDLCLPAASLLTVDALHHMPPHLDTLGLALRWAPKTSFITEVDVRIVLPHVRLIN